MIEEIKIEDCNNCEGTGEVYAPYEDDATKDCPVCSGKKKVCVIPYRIVIKNV